MGAPPLALGEEATERLKLKEFVRRETVCFLSETIMIISSSSSAVLPDAFKDTQIKHSHLVALYSPESTSGDFVKGKDHDYPISTS